MSFAVMTRRVGKNTHLKKWFSTRPTACLFGSIGEPAEGDRLERRCVRAGLAVQYAETNLEKTTQSGRYTEAKNEPRQGIAQHEGQAAPTRATLKRFRLPTRCGPDG